ncbi:hypothetical protein [Nocardia wallacei]|uniref:hypothetical protein n=1 Tax=Nocardia wallacei TaxID=480035 RepID=UPI0024554924|nr:hypothetical protein [Nocardia wallacei]
MNPIAISYGETVEVLRGERDRTGDGEMPVHHTIEQAVFWPESITGDNDRRTASVVIGNLAVPRGSDVRLTDRIRRSNGSRWIPQGPVQWDMNHPMTGWNPGYEIIRVKGVS